MIKLSNIIYKDQLFNEEIKKKYINRYKNEATQKVLLRIFKVSCLMEIELNKDLYAFSREELRKLLYRFMPKTPHVSRSNVAYVHRYIEWAIENGLRKGLNPLDSVDTAWKEQFFVTNEKRFWTDKEIDKMLNPNKLVNAQDRVIIALLFEGVRGNECAEITNLRRQDVDFEKKILTLKDSDESIRTLEVSDKCIATIQKALEEEDYIKKNGNPSADIRAEKAELIDNDYVVRSAHTRTINFENADKNIVYRRLEIVANEFNKNELTPTDIFYSGMLAYAKDLYLKYGVLGGREYEMIKDRFKLSSAIIQRLKSDFLNEDYVKELYNLES